ncbi:MAG TPA: hypothetical protein PLI77_09315 [Bacteroidales bacterium]|jgi:hypothetical protein|nr:hypothetical protein [Bacteroidales bacterium]HPE41268.1 hypothetical protein [Bacteroidales bacterium]
MKKLILLPKTDTVTICLPPEWVGRPIICILKAKETIVYEQEVQELAVNYAVKHITGRKRKNRREHDLRRKRASKNGFI